MLPSVAEMLGISIDELFGIPQEKKEKLAHETFDRLRVECMKRDYDAELITEAIRDIRRNYMKSSEAWRPWCEGNERAFSDARILPEVRLLAEEYLRENPTHTAVINTMVRIEDEEHIGEFLDKYATEYDMSRNRLMLERSLFRRDSEKFEIERAKMFFASVSDILWNPIRYGLFPTPERERAADEFAYALISALNTRDGESKVDVWTDELLELRVRLAGECLNVGKTDEALSYLTDAVELLENTMKIRDTVALKPACSFIDGLTVTAEEHYASPRNDPEADEERYIYIEIFGCGCYCIYPSNFYNFFLRTENLEALVGNDWISEYVYGDMKNAVKENLPQLEAKYTLFADAFERNRSKLAEVWDSLPTSVFSGDEGDPYILNPDGHFVGFASIEVSGRDVCVNEFMNAVLLFTEEFGENGKFALSLAGSREMREKLYAIVRHGFSVIAKDYTFTEGEIDSLVYLYRVYIPVRLFYYGDLYKFIESSDEAPASVILDFILGEEESGDPDFSFLRG